MKNKAKQAFLAVVTALGAGTVTAQTLAQPGEACMKVSAHQIFSKEFERARNACVTTNFSERAQKRCMEAAEYQYNVKMANHPSPLVEQYCVSADFHTQPTMPIAPAVPGVVVPPLSQPTIVLTPGGIVEYQHGPGQYNYNQNGVNGVNPAYPRQQYEYNDRDNRGRRDDRRHHHGNGNYNSDGYIYVPPVPGQPTTVYPRQDLPPVKPQQPKK